ncbi:Sec-independent protein translocase protein TatB [Brevundimonas sp.]|uniref:Sec-independent protein translocase protein TatB n=1 Tax=Brevundimonas sp. TaxID=1871086 RepID=UPI002D441953|nr:Sec-independent protein translocase protein TatB [Brevundimonas sp.]HYD28306.1 Sec-independent protein translocase protein TatB [Brevundimonas sp.]
MGGLGPGIGGLEILVIGLVALLVVGPKDLPVLMRKVGKAMARARAMANEFRSSFDEMARQSELDELRKEVEALRTGQGLVPLGAEADAAFRDIRNDLNRPLYEPAGQPALDAPDEWPDSAPVMQPLETVAAPEPKPAPKPTTKPAPKPAPKKGKAATPRTAGKPRAAKKATARASDGKPRPTRAKKVDL